MATQSIRTASNAASQTWRACYPTEALFPIGINRIEFNAHRVSDPRLIVDMAERNGLLLSSLTTVKDGREVKRATRDDLADLARARYVLGVFVLV